MTFLSKMQAGQNQPQLVQHFELRMKLFWEDLEKSFLQQALEEMYWFPRDS